MPLAFYKVLHILAVFFVISALGGLALHAASGQRKDANPLRKLVAILHGAGLVLALIGGFGALAKMGVGGALIPGWAWAKMVIWLLLGGAIAVPYRAPHLARHLLWVVPVLGGVATWLAIYKPF